MSQPPHVGPYQLLRPLGVGGMAETFLALRRGPAGFEQRVCLKRILPAYTAEPRFVELFLDEARLLARMHSASIVQVVDFGEADGTYYMALELVEGTDLEALLRSGVQRQTRLPISVALYITAQLLAALDYAHNLVVDGQPLHIVHRDISPSNVLLSKHGEVKLTDFGVAKSRQRAHKTKPDQTRGKLAYMCPEQLRGDPLDARSDLFSLGVVLYEMLAGAHPFVADSEMALVENILNSRRANLRALVPELPLAAKQLLDRLLAPAAEGRPASAREALGQLQLREQPFLLQQRLAECICAGPAPALEPLAPSAGGAAHAATTAPLRAPAQRVQEAPRVVGAASPGPRASAAPSTPSARAASSALKARAASAAPRRTRWLLASALAVATGVALSLWQPANTPRSADWPLATATSSQAADAPAHPAQAAAPLHSDVPGAAAQALRVAGQSGALATPESAADAGVRAELDRQQPSAASLDAPDDGTAPALPAQPPAATDPRTRALRRAAAGARGGPALRPAPPSAAGRTQDAAPPSTPHVVSRSGLSVHPDEF